MNQEEAINRFSDLIKRAEQLLNRGIDDQDFKKWHRDTEIAVKKIFAENKDHIKEISNAFYPPSIWFPLYGLTTDELKKKRQSEINSVISLLKSFIDEINDYGFEYSVNEYLESSAVDKVLLIINRFHQVARQLQARHGDRSTIEIEDEYDVQDLFHALLKLYFDDIRPEEYTPSYAGSASRVDFLLKDEQIIIEIKKTRNSLKAKEVGEQLIIDTQKYQAHSDCKTLICFVYDPEGKIANPRGIERDLSKDFNGLPVSVFITP